MVITQGKKIVLLEGDKGEDDPQNKAMQKWDISKKND